MSSQQRPHPFALIDWNRINHALTYALFHGGNLPPGFMPDREPERDPQPTKAEPDLVTEIHDLGIDAEGEITAAWWRDLVVGGVGGIGVGAALLWALCMLMGWLT